jgi:NADP-dependent 3-hydroxy acid dehydrogenase YdfG
LTVNNAGTINKNNKTWNVPAEDFDMVVDTNIKGTANVLRHFVPLMIEKRHGIIVNLSSGWGRSAAAEVGLIASDALQWFLSVKFKSSVHTNLGQKAKLLLLLLHTNLHVTITGGSVLCFKVGD